MVIYFCYVKLYNNCLHKTCMMCYNLLSHCGMNWIKYLYREYIHVNGYSEYISNRYVTFLNTQCITVLFIEFHYQSKQSSHISSLHIFCFSFCLQRLLHYTVDSIIMMGRSKFFHVEML